MAIITIGRYDSIGPEPDPMMALPHPHWKTATTSPKEAATASRFMNAAVSGIKMLLRRP